MARNKHSGGDNGDGDGKGDKWFSPWLSDEREPVDGEACRALGMEIWISTPRIAGEKRDNNRQDRTERNRSRNWGRERIDGDFAGKLQKNKPER